MTPTRVRLVMALLLGFAAVQCVGCAGNGRRAPEEAPAEGEAAMRDEGYWIAHGVPRLTTIARHTTWSCVRGDDTDTIVLKERRQRADGSTGRLTWLISFVSPPVTGSPIVLDGTQAHGWLIEEGDGQRAYAAALAGEVVVHERTEDRLVATLNLAMNLRARGAVREDDDAGVRLQADVELTRRRVELPSEDLTIRTFQGGR